jgi:alkaline phosphatase D
MPGGDVAVRWEVSADESFTAVHATGDTTASAADAFSVHVVVGLDDDVTWWYRFRVGQHTSPAGRTRRAPSGDVPGVTFASASCQNYEAGFYAAHRDLAAQAPAFVVWLGDYIYEAAAGAYGAAAVRSHGTAAAADLGLYRQRYARYKTDPDLQAAHAACPWFVVWDDHEVRNNYAGLTSPDPAFAARRAAAYRAWWEHVPVRLPAPSALDADPTADYPIYRDARWGDLLGLALVDGRQYRSAQACSGPTAAGECAGLDDATRTMLGDAQEQWLGATFGSWGTTWNVLGNQTVVTDMRLAGTVLNPDQWDGYPAAQARLLEVLGGSANAVVLTGDIHASIVGQLHGAAGPIGVELVCTSISTGSAVDASAQPLVRLIPGIVDADLAHRGYLLHTVTADEWHAELRLVDDARLPDSPVAAGASFRIGVGTNTVQRA